MLRQSTHASARDNNFFLIEKTSIHFIIHCYTKQNKGFQQYPTEINFCKRDKNEL